MNCENIVEASIIAFGPEMSTGRHLDQLCRDSDATAGPADAAIEYVVDLQLPGHQRQVDVLALERERSVA